MSKIKVILVDDHTILRKGVRALLEGTDDIEIVAEVGDGKLAVDLITEHLPDVAIVDITLPGISGLEVTRRIKKTVPEVGIVILSMHEHEEYVSQALVAGAEGYLVKKTAPEQLVAAIRAVHQGNAYLSHHISHLVIDSYLQRLNDDDGRKLYDALTRRERQVLEGLALGKSIKDVAEELSISDKTVRTHKSNLMKKLKISGIGELIHFALRYGIVTYE